MVFVSCIKLWPQHKASLTLLDLWPTVNLSLPPRNLFSGDDISSSLIIKPFHFFSPRSLAFSLNWKPVTVSWQPAFAVHAASCNILSPCTERSPRLVNAVSHFIQTQDVQKCYGEALIPSWNELLSKVKRIRILSSNQISYKIGRFYSTRLSGCEGLWSVEECLMKKKPELWTAFSPSFMVQFSVTLLLFPLSEVGKGKNMICTTLTFLAHFCTKII